MAHGNHWAVFDGEPASTIPGIVSAIVENGALMQGSSLDVVGILYPDVDLSVMALLQKHQDGAEVISAFPCALLGISHTLLIREVHEWENGGEAQVVASVNGEAEVRFFESFYFRDREKLKAGEERTFMLAAIAYHVAPAEVVEFERPELASLFPGAPTKVSNRHASLMYPMRKEVAPRAHPVGLAHLFDLSESLDLDDYSFQAPISEVDVFPWAERTIYRIRATFMRLESDFDLMLYATDLALAPGYVPKVGDDIRGACWLQGAWG